MSDEIAQPPTVIRHNYRRGVINGVLFALGEALSSAGLVLALLVRQLGGSLAVVGLLPALQSGGYLLPQLIVGGRIQPLPLKLPLYRSAAVMRLSAFFAMCLAIFASGLLPSWLSIGLIVIFYAIYNLGGGTSMLAFQDIVAKTIPPRQRGSYFGTRQLVGGLLGFAVAGPLVRWLLGDDTPVPFPFNFGILALLALVSFAIGMYAFIHVIEPPQANPGPRMSAIEGLRRAPSMLREHRNYRWYIISRMLSRAGQLAEPFYIIYATEVLGLPASVAGVYLAVRAITGSLSNLGWSRISARRGNRRLILMSNSLIVMTPALALIGPALVARSGLGQLAMGVALGLVFLLVGVSNDGSNLSSIYLMEVVPADERPTYMGFANTMLGLMAFVPVLGAWLVTRIGYQGTFAISLVVAAFGLLSATRLQEVNPPELRAKVPG